MTFCTSFVLHKVKKASWRFQVEACRAYARKQILGLCHSSPRLEIWVARRKIKPHGGKNPVEPLSACQKPGAQVKILCWYVTCFTYTLVWKRISVSSCGDGDWCHSLILLWHVLFAACFALLSHDDDLYPRETLSVQLYEICDSPSITGIQTFCLRGFYLL